MRQAPSTAAGAGQARLGEHARHDAADGERRIRPRCRSAPMRTTSVAPRADDEHRHVGEEQIAQVATGEEAGRDHGQHGRDRHNRRGHRQFAAVLRGHQAGRACPGRAHRERHDRRRRRLGAGELAGNPCRRASRPRDRSCRGSPAAPTRSSGSPVPARRARRIIAWISAFAPTSMPCVGSSRISTAGLVDNHRASATFCWLPPESESAGAATDSVLIRSRST